MSIENPRLEESVYYDALAAAIKTPNSNAFGLSNRGDLGDTILSLSDKEPIDCDDIKTASLANTNRKKKLNENEVTNLNSLRKNIELSETPPNTSSSSVQSGEANKLKLNGDSNSVIQIKSHFDTSRIKSKVPLSSEIQVEQSLLTPSKIPVLTSNLRQLKCASWAGVDTANATLTTVDTPGAYFLQNPTTATFAPIVDITDNPKKGQHYSSTLHNFHNIADLTPGLSSKSMLFVALYALNFFHSF